MDQGRDTTGATLAPRKAKPGDEGGWDGGAIFRSILFPPGLEGSRSERADQPACFVDLNLDQVVAAIVAKRDEALLRPFLYSTYRNEQIIRYRQAVFRDLERPDVLPLLPEFCEGMWKVRLDLSYAEKITYKYHREMVLLRAIGLYCETIGNFHRQLDALDLQSLGLRNLRQYLADYVSSGSFLALASQTREMRMKLSEINYGMLFRGDKVTVRKYASETDYTTKVLERFSRFREVDVERAASRPTDDHSLNHIEEGILEFVGRLYPETFVLLEDYARRHARFIDETVQVVDREIGFFRAYLAYIEPLEKSGLHFCYPEVSASDKETDVLQSFDLALAAKLVNEKAPVVCNDFHLAGVEQMIVVSGPNQGGKTTFARMFGQLHFLAGLGCPVPGQRARLFLADQLFTHFEREEDITNLRGKLEDDLVRLRKSCRAMTVNSIIILNEMFNSTSLEDQIFLSAKVLEEILATDALAVCVTFIDALRR